MKKLFLPFAVFMMALNPTNIWAEGSQDITITVLEGTGFSETESPDNLFDGKYNTKWCIENFSYYGSYVIFKLNRAATLTGYTLVDGDDTYSMSFYGRHWDSWTIYGASFNSDQDVDVESSNWTMVDTQSNQKYTEEITDQYTEGDLITSEFNVENAGKYQYYMIKVTGIGESYHVWDEEELDNVQQMADILFTWSVDNEQDNNPTCIQDINVSTSTEAIYDINGRRQQTLSKGLNIIKQTDGSVKKVVVE